MRPSDLHADECDRGYCLPPLDSDDPDPEGLCCAEDHDRAVDVAKALVRKLGKGWRSEVWQNNGWHAGARSPDGNWQIIAHGFNLGVGWSEAKLYTVVVSRGSRGSHFATTRATPGDAIAVVKLKVKADIAHLQKLLKGS